MGGESLVIVAGEAAVEGREGVDVEEGLLEIALYGASTRVFGWGR